MQPIISIQNISKQYRLGVVGSGTLRNDLARWWAHVRGKEDPFLKIGETNVRNSKGGSEYVWALKDISFDVMPGEVLGIIGKNGAGKSTLLKILSKVTGPTTGSINYNGRIGSLLEVGTGFHPELTGRDNIFLNGAILGMTKAEIRAKLDEIIDFAGVERYIDTPVKRYSSGMMVRLGFAVAAHLEPEILVVDEVLAVGDAEFQRKAIGKMQDVSSKDGRTVLFVSHNMASIQNLCTSCLIMIDGGLYYFGETSNAIEKYLSLNINDTVPLVNRTDRRGNQIVRFARVYFTTQNDLEIDMIQTGNNFDINIHLESNKIIENVVIRAIIVDSRGNELTVINNGHIGKNIMLNKGKNIVKFHVKNFPLTKGTYNMHLLCFNNQGKYDELEFAKSFEVIAGDFFKTGKDPVIHVPFLIKYQ